MFPETPKQVADAAVTPDALSLDQLSLLGIVTTPDGRSALLRSSDGTVTKHMTGERFAGTTITAITETSVLLSNQTELHLPQGS